MTFQVWVGLPLEDINKLMVINQNEFNRPQICF